MIDHPLLYSDEAGFEDWKRLVEEANDPTDSFWRKYARRKMRRVEKQLLRGIRPNINLGEGWTPREMYG
jgi:hypothetical protein